MIVMRQDSREKTENILNHDTMDIRVMKRVGNAITQLIAAHSAIPRLGNNALNISCHTVPSMTTYMTTPPNISTH